MLQKSPKCHGARAMKIRTGKNMFGRWNHLLHHFSIPIHLHLATFYLQNTSEKKKARENAHWTNYWISLEGAWTRDGNRPGRPAPVGLPIGSRFFDRPVKLVETPVEFSFLATTKHLSTNRNIVIYFIINKTFYKKSVLTNHIFRKHLLNGFQLWLICCDH